MACRFSATSDGAVCQLILVASVAAFLLTGCHTAEVRRSRSDVSAELTSRFGVDSGDQFEAGEAVIPPGVLLEDGVSEDEAVRVALWNNAGFQEMLTQLGISNAQLFDAGLISDPQFSMFLPLGPKQLEFTMFQAVDALWLQPIRVKAAELDVDRVSQSMVQNGLDVIRDARVAHANLLAATQQAEVSREAATLRAQIADFAQKRLEAGDISELEAITSRIDALQAKTTADRAVHDVTLARDRLRVVMGLSMLHGQELNVESRGSTDERPEAVVSTVALDSGLPPLDSLLNEALAMRPDLRAAEIAIEVAGERAGLARNQFMNLDAVYDANTEGQRGFESGPGLRFTVPIFNGNQGGIAIADAQWEQAVRRYVTVRDQVTLDVRNAFTQMEQAEENLVTVQSEILPALRDAEELARRNYENGGTPYFFVLQTTGQYLDARNRELQLVADLSRARAELDRSVGRRVQSLGRDQSRESSVQSMILPVRHEIASSRHELSSEQNTSRKQARPPSRPAPTFVTAPLRRRGWHATPK